MATLNIKRYEVRIGDGPGEKAPLGALPCTFRRPEAATRVRDLLSDLLRTREYDPAIDAGKSWYVEEIDGTIDVPDDTPGEVAASPLQQLADAKAATSVYLLDPKGQPFSVGSAQAEELLKILSR